MGTTTLSADASSPGAARRFVNDVLVNRAMEDVAEVAALLTSELVTNAILRARSTLCSRCSSARPTASRELLEEADELCARGELLTLPATTEVRALRRWVTAELWSQLHLERKPQRCPL